MHEDTQSTTKRLRKRIRSHCNRKGARCGGVCRVCPNAERQMCIICLNDSREVVCEPAVCESSEKKNARREGPPPPPTPRTPPCEKVVALCVNRERPTRRRENGETRDVPEISQKLRRAVWGRVYRGVWAQREVESVSV